MASSANSPYSRKLTLAILGGLIVGLSAAAVDVTVISFQREVLIHQLVGDFIAALVATLVCLALQLRNEEVHYRLAMERAAIVSELNHHVRNAIFPLCLAVQRNGDAESQRLSSETIERINIAMKDAAADVFSLRVRSSPPPIGVQASSGTPA